VIEKAVAGADKLVIVKPVAAVLTVRASVVDERVKAGRATGAIVGVGVGN
jgi:hypothetical protein